MPDQTTLTTGFRHSTNNSRATIARDIELADAKLSSRSLYLNQTQQTKCAPRAPRSLATRVFALSSGGFVISATRPHSKTRQRISIAEITIVLRIGAFVPTVFATYTNYRAFRARVHGEIERALEGGSPACPPARPPAAPSPRAPADRVTECRSLYSRGVRGV
jgi:hypothetical protein